MEKVPGRPSGGGGKLGTLDMADYLEVMGKQLAEMQAQHQQFCANRSDRQGRVAAIRNQDEDHRLKRSMSSSSSPSGVPPARNILQGSAVSGTHGSPAAEGSRPGTSEAGASGSNQGGARRSLNYGNTVSSEGCHLAGMADPSGASRGLSLQSDVRHGLRTSSSTPLPVSGPPYQGHADASSSRPPTPTDMISISPSTSVAHSRSPTTPTSGSFVPHPSAPNTPSTHLSSTPGGGAMAGPHAPYSAMGSPTTVNTVSGSAGTSPLGGSYAVYHVSESAQGTPNPGHRAGAGATNEALRLLGGQASSRRAAARPDLSPRHKALLASAAAAMGHVASPATASVASSALAVHGHVSKTSAEQEDGSDGEVGDLPYPLALAGQPYDGVDSEEDYDDGQALPAAQLLTQQQQQHTYQHSRGQVASADASVAAALRSPLVQASMGTDDAIRALLASQHFARLGAMAGGDGGVSASIDGLEVPDDVLAALANAEDRGLDEILGIHQPSRMSAASSGRGGRPGMGMPAARVHAQAPLGSHLSAGLGSLTAAPAALPAAGAGRVSDTSGRLGSVTPGSQCAAATAYGAARWQPTAGVLAAQAPQGDASIELDAADVLSRTLDLEEDIGHLALQQQARQPVLYSVVPRQRSSSGTGAGDAGAHAPASRRTTAQGDEERQGHLGRPETAQALPDGPRPGTAVGAISPAGTPRRRTAEALPRGTPPSGASSARRFAGEGDSVLFGSPSGRNAGPDGGAPSPYVPPSPPPGADPLPYTAASPPSRLQGLGPGARLEQRLDTEVGPEQPAGASCESGGDVPVRPSSGRRLLSAHPASSGGSPGTSFDLSLTQAAAVSGGRPSTGHLTSILAGSSARAGRTPQAQQQQAAPEEPFPAQPMCTTFSLAGLSSTASGNRLSVASHDLEVDDAGRPLPSSPSPRSTGAPAATAGAVAAQLQAAQAVEQAMGPVVSGAPKQLGLPAPTAPPLASFARAAALAAAADLGLPAPPPTAERRRSGTGAGDVRAKERAGGEAGRGDAAADLDGEASFSSSLRQADRMRQTGQHEHLQPQPRTDHQEYQPDGPLSHGQSPAGSHTTISAKLSQLKARRQSQRQSLYGLQSAQPTPGLDQSLQSGLSNPNQPSRAQPSTSHLGTGTAQPPRPGHRVPDSEMRMGRHNPVAASGSSVWASTEMSADFSRGQGPTPTETNGVGYSSIPAVTVAALAGHARAMRASEAGGGAGVQAGPGGGATRGTAPAGTVARVAAPNPDGADRLLSAELSLGHGVSGLSVDSEMGDVKWAWHTAAAGAAASGTPGPSSNCQSPGGSSASPWASPTFASGGTGTDGDDQASMASKLPPPQWHVARPGMASRAFGGERSQDEAAGQPARPCGERGLAQGQQGVSEQAGEAQPGLGSAGSSGGVAASGASKALALLRLKQQSIQRHHVALATNAPTRGPDPHADSSQADANTATAHARAPRGTSAPSYRSQRRDEEPAADQRPAFSRPASAAAPPPLPPGAAERGPKRPAPVAAWQEEQQPASDSGDGGGDEGAAPPKPFLKRRSSKVPARKVDWSHVKPRTNSRNPDYYEKPSSPRNGAGYRPGMSPITSPKGISKPPLNAANARGWKAAGKLPGSPTGADPKAGAAVTPPSAAAARRRLSNIPPAPGYAAAHQAASAARPAAAAGSGAGAGLVPAGGHSPLDDLLAHVNGLLRDFDKMVR